MSYAAQRSSWKSVVTWGGPMAAALLFGVGCRGPGLAAESSDSSESESSPNSDTAEDGQTEGPQTDSSDESGDEDHDASEASSDGDDAGSGEEDVESESESESDSGESDTTAGDESTESTTDEGTDTDGAVCGDGILQGEEECDDGNDEDGDGCNGDCTLPKPVAWEREIGHGTASGAALAMVASDHFRALFGHWDEENSWVELRDFDGEGELTATARRAGRFCLPTLSKLFVDAEGRSHYLEVEGRKDATGNTPPPWAVQLSASGELDWEYAVPRAASVIMSTAGAHDGRLGLSAAAIEDETYFIWSGLYGASGAVHSTMSDTEETALVADAALGQDGTIVSLVSADHPDGSSAANLVAIDPAGNVAWRTPLSEAGIDAFALGGRLRAGPNGFWAFVAHRDGGYFTLAVVAVDKSGKMSPAVLFEDERPSFDTVTVTKDGDFLFGDSFYEPNRDRNVPRLRRYTPEGQRIWSTVLGQGNRGGSMIDVTMDGLDTTYAMYSSGTDEDRETWVSRIDNSGRATSEGAAQP